jgi:mannan endo-1,4-beta-mannosidase
MMPMRWLGSVLAGLALASPYVQRSGAHLELGGKPYRFGGANIEWLGLSNYGPAYATPPRYATDFEVDDALDTARELGARVVRSQTLGDSVGCALCLEPALGVFNAQAFARVDYALKAANDRGLKVILTIVGDDAANGGSGCVYLRWRSIDVPNCSLSNMAPFFTDPQVIGDVEQHIDALLNHINRYDGITYRDDPTILGWDLMNGGGSPPAWTKTIADHIRTIDKHHLILSDAQNAGLKNVDACVSFIYPHWHQGLAEFARPRIDACARAKKPYIAYEYGWDRTNWPTLASFKRFLGTLRTDREIAGDAFWALEAHADQGGWRPMPAEVTDPHLAATAESGEWWALYYPGVATRVNTAADMRARALAIRAHNYAMAGVRTPAHMRPPRPQILSTSPLRYRGSAGAVRYVVERVKKAVDLFAVNLDGKRSRPSVIRARP